MKREKKNKIIWNQFVFGVVTLLLTVIVSACDTEKSAEPMSLEELLSGQLQGERSESDMSATVLQTEEGIAAEQGTVWIHICGEVAVPGIYELPVGSRVYDALMAAGGFTADADTTYHNLASYVSEGMQIEVPRKSMTTTGTTNAKTSGKDTQDDGRININTATSEELQKLPGIGETRARDIIGYRQKNGEFKNTGQIMEVSGIKEAIFEKIKDLIKTE